MTGDFAPLAGRGQGIEVTLICSLRTAGAARRDDGKGRKETRDKGRKETRDEGRKETRDEGRKETRDEGRKETVNEGRKETIDEELKRDGGEASVPGSGWVPPSLC